MNLELLLELSPTKAYSPKDLKDPHILDHALKLFFHARFGQVKQQMRKSSSIEHDKLPLRT